MKKSLLYSTLVALSITIFAGVAMFFVPLPGEASSNPDQFIEKSYGFPLVFKTTQSGGFAGTTQSETNAGNLALNLLIIAGAAFALSFVVANIVKRK